MEFTLTWVQLFSIVIPIAIGLIALVAIFKELSKITRRPALDAKRIVNRYEGLIDELGLEPGALAFIRAIFIPELEEAILSARQHRFWFRAMTRWPIGLGFATAGLTVLASGLWAGSSELCLAAIGLLAAATTSIGLFDLLDQNGPGWKDAGILEHALRDCIEELLTATPEIPIAKQFSQFAAEYQAIRLLKQKNLERRIDASQAAAKAVTEQATAEIQSSRAEYRAAYSGKTVDQGLAFDALPGEEPLTRSEFAQSIRGSGSSRLFLDLEQASNSGSQNSGDGSAAASQATIGDTGLTTEAYIAMSTSGDDDNTAAFDLSGYAFPEAATECATPAPQAIRSKPVAQASAATVLATIGDTGITPAQYIALSTTEDEDTAFFLNQGANR